MLILDKNNPLGTPVETEDGLPARLICVDQRGTSHPILALIARVEELEFLGIFDVNGNQFTGTKSAGCNLVNKS